MMSASDEEYGITWADVEHGERFQHAWRIYASLVDQKTVDAAVVEAEDMGQVRARLDPLAAVKAKQAAAEAEAFRVAEALRQVAMKRAQGISAEELAAEIDQQKTTNPYLMADLHEVQAVQQARRSGMLFQEHQIGVPVPAFTMIRLDSGGVVPCKPGEMVMGMTVDACREISHSEGVFTYKVQVVMK